MNQIKIKVEIKIKIKEKLFKTSIYSIPVTRIP